MTQQLPKSFSTRQPDGDTHARDVCDTCGFINYVNPRIVVGSVVTYGDRVLLCRRAIEPRRGFWTIPAGYLELGETPEEGALREAHEEAEARLTLHGLLAIYTVRHLSQVQLIFHGTLNEGRHAPGEESLETMLCAWDAIPWDALAFPTVHLMLNDFRAYHSGTLALPVARDVDASPA